MELAELYRDIVEASPDGIWVVDLEGRTQYANAQVAALLGVPAGQQQAVSVFDVLDPDGRDELASHLAADGGGQPPAADLECRLLREDGTVLWVLLRETPLHDSSGAHVGTLLRLTEYDDRRRLFEELSAASQQLAEAQRIARFGSWEWDLEHDVVRGSDGIHALYGVSPSAELSALPDFMALVHPQDRAIVETAVLAAIEGSDDLAFEARIRSRDGWVWTRSRAEVTRDDAGRALSMSGTHQDITEFKEAQEALEDMVRQNALMQAVAAAANEAADLEEVLGNAQTLVLLHDDWERGQAFVPSEDGTDVIPFYLREEDRAADAQAPVRVEIERRAAQRALRERSVVWDDDRLTIAFPVLLGDDVVAVVAMTSSPPLSRHEMIQSMVEEVAVQLARVAERDRAARELAAARDQAMEASRQKSEFLATMSHEIRTPLNGVIGLNDLLMRTHLDDHQHRLVSGVQVASRALLAVINDILDFSKIEAGRLELEHLDFDVRSVFDQVASVIAESARAKGLELMVACHPDVPEVLAGDPTRLAQVLTNLGSNAVKFTSEGEVLIRATAEAEDGGHLLRVEVSDTGIGVDDEQRQQIFDPFSQADVSTTRRFGGTGLGLAIAHEIVGALGGEIGVESNPGKGSTFWFTARFDDPAGSQPDPLDERARHELAGVRILVVDDNDHNRMILREQLSWWEVPSQSVASADDAIAALEEARASGEPFGAVLLDMAMPHRDGLHLAYAVRRDPSYDDVSLIMLTSSTPPDETRLQEAGISACLTKPVLASSLRGALLRELGGPPPEEVMESPALEPGVSRRVLIVEDNPVNQLVAVGILDALGYASDTVSDGLEALDAVAAVTYDAVLMDVQMPRMDGYTATRRIRERELPGARIPVLAMTAAAIEGERERCLDAGMDDFLTKPVDPVALGAMLDLWVSGDPTAAHEKVGAVGTPEARSGAGPSAAGAHDPTDAPADGSATEAPEEHRLLSGLDLDRLDMLRDLDPGNTSYLDRAITNFVNNSYAALDTIRTAVAAGDAEAMRQAAHKLRGSAMNLGVPTVGAPALDLESLGDTGSTTGADAMLVVLEQELERGRQMVLAYQRSYSESDANA
ncbi:response regulator [Nocardioides pacificus]